MTWSVWYVVHNKGRGLRVKTNPPNAVYAGAGSTSQMISGIKGYDYELRQDKNTQLIRFSDNFRRKHEHLISIAVTLDMWKEYKHRKKIGKDQQTLEEFF